MKKYITVAGDVWDLIAFKNHGTSQTVPLIMDANPEHVEVFMFSGGMELNIPDKPEKATSSKLPPWKQI